MSIRFLFALSAVLAINTPAAACIVERELRDETKAMSDLVIVGTPIDYEQIETKGWGGRDSFVTFNIEDLVSGTYDPKTIKAFIPISTYGAPDTLEDFKKRYGERVKFGVILSETYAPWCETKERTIEGEVFRNTICPHKDVAIEFSPEIYPDMPTLVRQHCTRLYMERVE